MSQVERLVNFMAVLLDSNRALTADEIRRRVNGYDQANTDAFRRTFERDKKALREMGVPLRVEPRPEGSEGAESYRIRAEEYQLDDPGLTAEEGAALALALQAVRLEGDGINPEDPRYAILKLGIEGLPNETFLPAVAAVDVADDRIGETFMAVSERRPISFDYRAADGSEARRRLEPSSIASVRGHWYVGGRDRDRDEDRVFRIDRIDGRVTLGDPGSFPSGERPDIKAMIEAGPWAFPGEDVEVEICFDADVAWRARNLLPASTSFREVGESVHAVLVAGQPAQLIDVLMAFGPCAEVLRPESLRAAVIAHLEALL